MVRLNIKRLYNKKTLYRKNCRLLTKNTIYIKNYK